MAFSISINCRVSMSTLAYAYKSGCKTTGAQISFLSDISDRIRHAICIFMHSTQIEHSPASTPYSMCNRTPSCVDRFAQMITTTTTKTSTATTTESGSVIVALSATLMELNYLPCLYIYANCCVYVWINRISRQANVHSHIAKGLQSVMHRCLS